MFVHEALLLLGMDVEEGKKDISDIDRDTPYITLSHLRSLS